MVHIRRREFKKRLRAHGLKYMDVREGMPFKQIASDLKYLNQFAIDLTKNWAEGKDELPGWQRHFPFGARTNLSNRMTRIVAYEYNLELSEHIMKQAFSIIDSNRPSDENTKYSAVREVALQSWESNLDNLNTRKTVFRNLCRDKLQNGPVPLLDTIRLDFLRLYRKKKGEGVVKDIQQLSVGNDTSAGDEESDDEDSVGEVVQEEEVKESRQVNRHLKSMSISTEDDTPTQVTIIAGLQDIRDKINRAYSHKEVRPKCKRGIFRFCLEFRNLMSRYEYDVSKETVQIQERLGLTNGARPTISREQALKIIDRIIIWMKGQEFEKELSLE